MTIKIYIGDINKELADIAMADSPTAVLIDSNNYKNFLTKNIDYNIVAYTALGDLPKNLEIVYDILVQADEIIYSPPSCWSDSGLLDDADPTASIQGLTENILLKVANQGILVTNIELCYLKNNLILLKDSRKTDQSQLWSVGCSITHGAGVNPNQRYGQLLADALNLKCSFLTRAGSSIQWAADQIIRSDIRPNDIIVWGLTESQRLTYIHKNNWLPGVTHSTYKNFQGIDKILPLKELLSENTLYNNIFAVERVLNFCQKIQVKLYIIGLLDPGPNFLRYIKSKKEINITNFPYKFQGNKDPIIPIYEDLGTDGSHPGPKQHQAYADFCQSALKKLNYI